jgi:hypothetical protein
VSEVSIAELQRRVEGLERRSSDQVSRELYERDRQSIKDDIGDIRAALKELKDSGTWAIRLVIGQFLALIVGLLMFLLGNP